MSQSQKNNFNNHEPAETFLLDNGSELMLSGETLRDMLCDVLNKGTLFRFKARGSSMSPFIKDGDVLTICPTQQSDIKNGTIVVYYHKILNRIIIHRIVGKQNSYYAVKGDNTVGTADLVYEADILGRVSGVRRNGKITVFGLGPGRFMISFLSRFDLLVPVMLPLRQIFYPMVKRVLF